MKIVVLVKHAMIVDYSPTIEADGKDFEKESLTYEINDWDRYALEEAIKIKEQKGAEVTAISVGSDCDATLRKCIALGVDKVIKVPFDSIDSWQIAEAIKEVVKTVNFELIFAGYQSQDLNNALVGPILAGMLNLPYATAVISAIYEDTGVRLKRELEEGVHEELTLPLPCLLTVQTGINQPRYVSISRIMKAKKKEIIEVPFTPKESSFEIKNIYYPEIKKGEVIEGSAEEISNKVVKLFEERGLL